MLDRIIPALVALGFGSLLPGAEGATRGQKLVWNGTKWTGTDSLEDMSVARTNKDGNDIFTTVDHKRDDGTKYRRSVLSGGSSPAYTTRTVTYYAADGTTVVRTMVFALTYTSGVLTNETKQ